ncbi:MAG: hypothetical protein U0572_08250 [Phycisphaerales bacterium]
MRTTCPARLGADIESAPPSRRLILVWHRALACIAALGAVGSAGAGLVGAFDVGDGASASSVQFDFADGNSYLFVVHWDGVQTGRSLFDIIDAAQPLPFSFETVTFPFGEALYAVGAGRDFNEGFGTPPEFLDYWHYWTRPSSAVAWDYAPTGFADRVVADGSWDGWVFGSDNAPSAIPTPAAVAAIVLGLRGSRRRR